MRHKLPLIYPKFNGFSIVHKISNDKNQKTYRGCWKSLLLVGEFPDVNSLAVLSIVSIFCHSSMIQIN